MIASWEHLENSLKKYFQFFRLWVFAIICNSYFLQLHIKFEILLMWNLRIRSPFFPSTRIGQECRDLHVLLLISNYSDFHIKQFSTFVSPLGGGFPRTIFHDLRRSPSVNSESPTFLSTLLFFATATDCWSLDIGRFPLATSSKSATSFDSALLDLDNSFCLLVLSPDWSFFYIKKRGQRDKVNPCSHYHSLLYFPVTMMNSTR